MAALDLIKIKNLIADQLPYKVGESVYHATPGSRKGVILEWRMYGSDGTIEYFVAFGPGELIYLSEVEITRDAIPE